jgi:hypothetical protein
MPSTVKTGHVADMPKSTRMTHSGHGCGRMLDKTVPVSYIAGL